MVCGSYEGGNTGLYGPFSNGIREGNVDGIQVVELNIPYSNKDNFIKRSYKFLLYSLKSISLVWKSDFDVLFSTSTPLTAAIPGIFSKIIKRKKFILEIRDLWPELPKAMGVIKNPFILFLLRVLELLAYKCADGIIGLSPGIVEGIRTSSNNSKKIIMIPNGCDIELFKNQITIPHLDTGLNDKNFIAIYTGTHGKANGLNSLIEAAKILKSKKKNKIKIVLIGDGSEKKKLQAISKEYELDNLIFLDPKTKVELVNSLHKADLGLQILSNIPEFYFGTSPNKFFDYISSGLPVLVNYPGWIAEIVVTENIGFYSNPEDPMSLAEKLIEASEHTQLPTMKKNSVKLAKSDFNRDILFSNFMNFILEIYHDKS